MVYQDYPQSTEMFISLPTYFTSSVRGLSSNRQCLKHEESPGLGKISTIRSESEQKRVRRVKYSRCSGTARSIIRSIATRR